MIMIVKTPGSQMGSPAAAEEGGEEVGGGRWESGERSEVQGGRAENFVFLIFVLECLLRWGWVSGSLARLVVD